MSVSNTIWCIFIHNKPVIISQTCRNSLENQFPVGGMILLHNDFQQKKNPLIHLTYQNLNELMDLWLEILQYY